MTNSLQTSSTPAKPSPRRLLKQTALAAGCVVAAVAAAVGAWLAPTVVQERVGDATLTSVSTVSVQESSLALACLPGLTTGQEALSDYVAAFLSDVTISSAAEVAELSGGGWVLNDNGETLQGLAASGDTSGELRGLVADSCRPAAGDLYLVGGSTEVGSTSILYLANPSQTSVNVTINGYGAAGQIAAGTQTLTLAAGEATAVFPAIWYPSESRLALHIEADAAGVVAWMQVGQQNGDVPRGVTTVPATAATSEATFVGVSDSDDTYLRILNPGDERIVVRVDVLSEAGTETLSGAEEIYVDAGAVFDVSLAGMGTDVSSIRVTAIDGEGNPDEAAFSATIFEALEGEASEQDELIAYQALANIVVGQASTSFVVPGQDCLATVAELGFIEVSAALVLVAEDEDAVVTIGSGEVASTVTVPAGTTVTVDLPDGEFVEATADESVFVSVVVDAETSEGPVRAIANVLGESGTLSTRQVELTPTF